MRMKTKQLHKVTKSALVRLIGLGSVVALREAGLVVVPGSKLKSLVDDLGWQLPNEEKEKKAVVADGGSAGVTATATADAQASLCDGRHDGESCGEFCWMNLPSDEGGEAE